MASPAITLKRDIPLAEGQSEHLYFGSLTAGTYATGGVLIDIPKNEQFDVLFVDSPGYVGAFTASTQLLKIFYQTDPAATGGADVALKEVANGADLSTAPVFHFIAIGS